MITKKRPSKPRTSDKKKAGRGCPGATCSPSSLEWRVHTPNLIQEMGNNNSSFSATMRQPLMILGSLLHKVGEEAARINDPALNALMCRLTIYSCADPESPEYDPELTERVMGFLPENTQEVAGEALPPSTGSTSSEL